LDVINRCFSQRTVEKKLFALVMNYYYYYV
jgi:hypothetical protein